jgi:adenylate cyclase
MLGISAALGCIAGIVTWATGLIDPVELDTVDTRFEVRGTQTSPRSVIVVGIDDDTFNALHERWPFRRSTHARVVREISRGRPRAIAYDVQFTEPTVPREDNALITAVDRAGPVALATTEVDEHGNTNVFGGEAVLRRIGVRAGNGIIPGDSGGVVRRVPHVVEGLESLPFVSAALGRGRRIADEDIGGREVWIDYPGPPGTIRTVSFGDVAKGRIDPEIFRDRVVVVGAEAPSLGDVHPTATSGSEVMSGAEIEAAAIDTVLRGGPLREVGDLIAIPLILACGLVVPLAGLRLSPWRSLLAGVGLGAVVLLGAQLAFNGGWIVPVVAPLLALVVSGLGSLAAFLILGAVERARVRDIFARFVPDTVVDELLARADDELRLGGVRREATVLFSDLRGFTTFSEKHEPDQVIEVLNRYLREMSDAILDHGGTLAAYLGDGIMALFGAPLEQPDHADRALESAREMVGTRLDDFNAWVRAAGYGEGFAMGVGINTGTLMSGNVGSDRRMEYTAIGDVTNTASRLEEMTKGTAHSIFLAESTRSALSNPPPDLRPVGELPVRGREYRVRVWTLNDLPRDRADSDEVS